MIRRVMGYLALISMRIACRYSNTTTQTVDEAQNYLRGVYVPEKPYTISERSITEQDQTQICLSIIIPVFNGERYLRECIESVLFQKVDITYELICINDGSTDSSLDILKEYANDHRVKIITQKNKGISAARNRGICEAKGQFLLFIDNDDIIAPTFLHKMIQSAWENHADIVKCGYQIIQNGQHGRKCVEYNSHTFTEKEIDVIYRFNGYCWGTIFRRELFERVSFPDGYWYEDMVTRLLLYPQCRTFSYVGEALYYYRVHSDNASGKIWDKRMRKALDQYYLTKQILDASLTCSIRFSQQLCLAYQHEIGVLLYSRTLGLAYNVREAVFVLACALNDELIAQCPDYIKCGTLSERMMNKALMARDFKQWMRVCKYAMYLY